MYKGKSQIYIALNCSTQNFGVFRNMFFLVWFLILGAYTKNYMQKTVKFIRVCGEKNEMDRTLLKELKNPKDAFIIEQVEYRDGSTAIRNHYNKLTK